jgi:hypothetical protein
VWFEWLMILVIVVGCAYMAMAWQALTAWAEQNTPNPTLYIFRRLEVTIGLYVLMLALTLMISRGRWRIAVWPLLGMLGYAVWVFGRYAWNDRLGDYPSLQLVQLFLFAASCSLLTWRSARGWLRRVGDEPDRAEIFS